MNNTVMICSECGEIDESFSANCSIHGRSVHIIVDKDSKLIKKGM